jgi:predicted RNA binding protein YcfA (HicA-like mRNA interferase family)
MPDVKPKFREIRRWLRQDGWVIVKRTATRHEHYKHPTKVGRVTIAGPDGVEPGHDTWKAIRRQAGWDKDGKHDI